MEPGIPYLWSRLPAPFATRHRDESPWSLLGEPLEELLDELPGERIESGIGPEVHLSGDRIAIGRGARIAPGVVIEGPAFIGSDVSIRPGAYIRSGVWIGDAAVVGASTEIKHSILMPGAKAPHLSYVGDSILGRDVNLGAGTVLSNFRHDGKEITIPTVDDRLPTGRRKLGAVLGDGVLTGCNCVLHPGCVVGAGTQLYPGVQLRSGLYPANTIIKLHQRLELIARD